MADAAPADIPRARVLIVDDDEHNLLAIRTVLEDIADIEVASSGEEALRHLLREEFAVILLDVFMPGMDGYETARIIRSREQTRRVPIVFLSAVNKEKEHLLRGYAMGAVDYVFKPVEPVVLRSKVAVFVDLFAMTREVQRKAEQEQALLDANLKANAERLRVEQELRLAEQRQAAIIQSLPIVLYLESRDDSPRVPQFVGGNFRSVTGFEFEDVLRVPTLWADRLHPDDRERVIAAISERAASGAMAIEYRWRCADGEYKHFLDQAVLLPGGTGARPQYAGTLLDVSERKELEHQLLHAHKMDAIGKLTGGIAHDFNNLLAAVLGGLTLIERRVPLAEEEGRILGMTRRAAEQGSELVSRLLAFSRRQQLRPGDIDLSALSTSLAEILSHTLGGLVEIEWRIAGDAWRAYADPTQLELALMNLAINARDAMPQGGLITFVIGNRDAPARNALGIEAGDYVVITVADEGSGIAPEMLTKVTEPFFTTKEAGKGTGLGLSMVYGFARQSGGTIDIQSEVGKGTRIDLWLPRARGTDRPQPSAEPPVAEGPDAPLSILLVDDHEAVRETTAAMLRDLGHKVDALGDGAAALKRLKQSCADYDFIVTDYAMPVISGDEILKRAKRICPGIPGIIISGYAEGPALIPELRETIVLNKPFTIEQLRGAISAAPNGIEPKRA
ncbi:response regulator [Sphingosinicella sp.]|uniref:response regulator n=1 Tax=Sphingosinicella sp. TaxID=1917971 RepID=UPI0040379BBE